jgi:hypothetical protein
MFQLGHCKSVYDALSTALAKCFHRPMVRIAFTKQWFPSTYEHTVSINQKTSSSTLLKKIEDLVIYCLHLEQNGIPPDVGDTND